MVMLLVLGVFTLSTAVLVFVLYNEVRKLRNRLRWQELVILRMNKYCDASASALDFAVKSRYGSKHVTDRLVIKICSDLAMENYRGLPSNDLVRVFLAGSKRKQE